MTRRIARRPLQLRNWTRVDPQRAQLGVDRRTGQCGGHIVRRSGRPVSIDLDPAAVVTCKARTASRTARAYHARWIVTDVPHRPLSPRRR